MNDNGIYNMWGLVLESMYCNEYMLNKFLSKKNQHTYGLLLRVVGTLMWVYLTAPIGAFVVILGELITWIDFDE